MRDPTPRGLLRVRLPTERVLRFILSLRHLCLCFRVRGSGSGSGIVREQRGEEEGGRDDSEKEGEPREDG
jgi:hypothetical protein